MTKPDWEDAPAWANYLAVDSSGDWWWYGERPILYKDGPIWMWTERAYSMASRAEWIKADVPILEERPARPTAKASAPEVTEEMVNRAMPHLIGVAGSEVRPVGQFYPGHTADESEFVNWKFLGRARVRRALTAALQEGKSHD